MKNIKNRFLYLSIMGVFVLATINVSVSFNQDMNMPGISLDESEALAWEWNNPLDWLSQGLRANEKEIKTPCSGTASTSNSTTITSPSTSGNVNVTVPNTGGAVGVGVGSSSGSISNTQTTTTTTTIPNGNKITCQDGGDINCTPCECC